jgi:hypothetical protein
MTLNFHPIESIDRHLFDQLKNSAHHLPKQMVSRLTWIREARIFTSTKASRC